nr:zinc finger, CCHC-type [Tanacetum cinerariifolium]
MMGTKFDIKKFDGKNDFTLRQVRIKALLEQQRLAAALEELPAATIAAYDNYDGGNILLGDGKECRVRGTCKVQVQMRDGSSFVLDNVRKTLKGKKQLREYQTVWKIKTGNVFDFCNQRSTKQCTKSEVAKHLGVAVIEQQNELVNEINVTLLTKLWRLDDVTSKVVLYRNMGFNKSGKYKKTFIGYGVGTGSVQVLQGVEFEVEPLEDHIFKVEPHGNVNHVAGSQEVQTQDLIYYHLARDREQHSTHKLFSYREDSNETAFVVVEAEKIYAHESLTFNNKVACEVISKWKVGLKDDMDARSDVYMLSNGCKKCSDDIISITRSIHQKSEERASFRMVSRRIELFLVVMIIVTSILASSEATRLLTEDDWLDKYERLLKHRLPRGPVPPSGPSLCHNALGLYKQSEFASTEDQSYCP